MTHVIKWHMQPDSHSRSWAATIENVRIDTEELLELEPSPRLSLPGLLKELLGKAKRSAEKEMAVKTPLTRLSWKEVCEEDYTL